MNKLVSRNPVQRFKQGNKIRKMGQASGGGLNLSFLDWFNLKKRWESLQGEKQYVKPTFKGTELDPNRVAKRHNYKENEVIYHLDKPSGIWYARWSKASQPNQGYYRVAEGSTGYDRFGNHKVLKNGRWIKIEETPAKTVIPVTSSYKFGKMGGWNRNIGVGNITDQESLRMLQEMGLSGSAQDIQNKINEVFGTNSVKVDNKWGNQSKAGLQALYDKWKKEQPVNYAPELPTSQQLVEHVQNQMEQNQMKPVETNVQPTIYKQMSQLTNGFTQTPTLSKTASTTTTQMPSQYEDMLRGKYKQGGQLPSRNIVKRFKQRNFRLVAQ